MIQKIILLIICFINLVMVYPAYLIIGNHKQIYDELIKGDSLPFLTEIMVPATIICPAIFALIAIFFYFMVDKFDTKIITNSIITLILVEVLFVVLLGVGLMLPLLKIIDKLS